MDRITNPIPLPDVLKHVEFEAVLQPYMADGRIPARHSGLFSQETGELRDAPGGFGRFGFTLEWLAGAWLNTRGDLAFIRPVSRWRDPFRWDPPAQEIVYALGTELDGVALKKHLPKVAAALRRAMQRKTPSPSRPETPALPVLTAAAPVAEEAAQASPPEVVPPEAAPAPPSEATPSSSETIEAKEEAAPVSATEATSAAAESAAEQTTLPTPIKVKEEAASDRRKLNDDAVRAVIAIVGPSGTDVEVAATCRQVMGQFPHIKKWRSLEKTYYRNHEHLRRDIEAKQIMSADSKRSAGAQKVSADTSPIQPKVSVPKKNLRPPRTDKS